MPATPLVAESCKTFEGRIKMAKKRRQSDIPYALRLQEKKMQEIGNERQDAAYTALCVALVVMNDELGLGYKRLVNFSKSLMVAIKEYYKDPEIEEAHLMQRLRQIGFAFEDGKLIATIDHETGEPIKRKDIAE